MTTATIKRPMIQPLKKRNQQQIIVIPQNMLVNGRLSSKDLKTIINFSPAEPVLAESARKPVAGLKRALPAGSPAAKSDSCYGSDSDSVDFDSKPVRKRANLDHLSPEEKLMRRKLKNRVAAQNARDKKRVKMEDMEAELARVKAHAKTLEMKNAQLVEENRRLTALNDRLCSPLATDGANGSGVVSSPRPASPLVVPSRPFESAEGSGSALGMRAGSPCLVDIGDVFRQAVGDGDDVVHVKDEPEEVFAAPSDIKEEKPLENLIDGWSSADALDIDTDFAWEDTFNDLFPDL